MTARNVASPTTESLKDRFGLSSLIGKPLAIISDARFEGWGVQTAVERLLAISGEDAIDVDRKNRPIWNGRLGARFMIMTNKVPELGDSSGAISSRFLVLEMVRSWLGKEDRTLESRLMTELPGILLWAIDGLTDLASEDQFVIPESASEAHSAMEELSSPHAAFIADWCETGHACEIPCVELYEAWKRWCEKNGRQYPDNSARFGRDIRSAEPGISKHNRGPDGDRVRTYQGISLRQTPELEEAQAAADLGKNGLDPHVK
jgi:putative DNA primase/helicase